MHKNDEKQKNKTGRLGEDIAVKYLKNKSWKVLCRNFRKPYGEIDIIAKDKSDTIVFVEVKAQKGVNYDYFRPEMHFNRDKLRRITKTCYAYIQENGLTDNTDYRIDLAAININHNTRRAQVRYYKNAVLL